VLTIDICEITSRGDERAPRQHRFAGSDTVVHHRQHGPRRISTFPTSVGRTTNPGRWVVG